MSETLPSPHQSGKRRRIFFTEEQRDRLLLAYVTDPYPSQSKIEGLANELGVGVKTVVNWFHNHRMRSKQQSQHSSSPLSVRDSSVVAQFSDWQVDDDSSSPPSNVSSSSDANILQLPVSSQLSATHIDARQWAFSNFEQNSQGPPDFMTALELCVKRRSGDDLADNTWKAAQSSAARLRHRQSVNKRKRSRPQWVCEGRQLDRSQLDDDQLSNDEEHMEIDMANALGDKMHADKKLKNGHQTVASVGNDTYSDEFITDYKCGKDNKNLHAENDHYTEVNHSNEDAIDMRRTVKSESIEICPEKLGSLENGNHTAKASYFATSIRCRLDEGNKLSETNNNCH